MSNATDLNICLTYGYLSITRCSKLISSSKFNLVTKTSIFSGTKSASANNENKMQNEAQGHVDKAADVNKKDEGLMVNETNGKVRMVGEALPNVKDVEGNQVFKPEDMEAVAKTALSASDEKAILSKLKDTKALEEMQERERKNNRKADEATQKAINRELMQQKQNLK